MKDIINEHSAIYRAQETSLNSLTVAELISLYLAGPVKDRLYRAIDLLNKLNDLHTIINSSPAILQKHGLSTIEIYRIKGIAHMNVRATQEKFNISCSADAYKIALNHTYNLETEVFYSIYLRRNNDVIRTIKISQGGITGTVADPRIIIHNAILLKATGIILFHNHPSGNVNPSDSDKNLTRKIYQGANFLDINILDHLIVTDSKYFSFADEGLI